MRECRHNDKCNNDGDDSGSAAAAADDDNAKHRNYKSDKLIYCDSFCER